MIDKSETPEIRPSPLHPEATPGSVSGRGGTPRSVLTLAQQNAVDLLASGKTDLETAQLLNVHRVTVTRWRLYSEDFRAALEIRRANVWGSAADRLRSLLPRALDVLASALDGEKGVGMALALMRFAAALPLVPTNPIISGADYFRQEVPDPAPPEDEMCSDNREQPTRH